MESHALLQKRGFNVWSFGTGANVKLPGTAPDKPIVYNFRVPYRVIYEELRAQNEKKSETNKHLSENNIIMPLPTEYTPDRVGALACTFAALLLHDEKIEVDASKIKTLVNAAGVQIEPYWPSVFAKYLQGKNISDLLSNIGGGGAAAPVAATTGAAATGGAPAAAAAAETKKEEKKKEESESEEDEDAFGGLF